MAFKHGRNAEVLIDGTDLSAYFMDAALNVSVDAKETTTFKNTYKTFIEGDASAKVQLKGYYSPDTLEPLLSGMIRNGGSILTVQPGGWAAIGDMSRLVKIHEAQLHESSPVGGVVLATLDVIAEGIVGFGQGIHPLGTDVGTTTGAWTDDGAASALGWLAHLHITAVTGAPTSWTVKLQDSASSAGSHSDAADVTGATFAATNVAGAQRLQSAGHTTALRRYTRYVATVVGGTAPTITFDLSYSRNG